MGDNYLDLDISRDNSSHPIKDIMTAWQKAINNGLIAPFPTVPVTMIQDEDALAANIIYDGFGIGHLEVRHRTLMRRIFSKFKETEPKCLDIILNSKDQKEFDFFNSLINQLVYTKDCFVAFCRELDEHFPPEDKVIFDLLRTQNFIFSASEHLVVEGSRNSNFTGLLIIVRKMNGKFLKNLDRSWIMEKTRKSLLVINLRI